MSYEKCSRCGVLFQPIVPKTIAIHSVRYGSVMLCGACSDSFDAWLHFYNGVKVNSDVKSPWDIMDARNEPGYGDTIQEIMQSDMMSMHKKRSIKYIKRNETPDYYKAIIALVQSGMMSGDKQQAIFDLSKE